MRVSVVIPNINGKKYLDGCLHSLFESEPEGTFDVYLVDNGSEDGSTAYVEEYYPEVRIIEFGSNLGFCTAVNAGIRASQSEYVFLLNNDTEVEKGCISALAALLDRRKTAFSASARMVSMSNPDIIDDAGDYYTVLGWAFAYGKDRPASDYGEERAVFFSCGGAAMYRRALLAELGFFDELHFAYLEDLDVGYRARLHGYRNYYCPEAVVKHLGSGYSGSRHNSFKVKLSARNSLYVAAKNMPLLQLLFNLPFLLAGIVVKALYFTLKGLGADYIKGLGEGIKLSVSAGLGEKHQNFRVSALPQYILIEAELFAGLVRLLR